MAGLCRYSGMTIFIVIALRNTHINTLLKTIRLIFYVQKVSVQLPTSRLPQNTESLPRWHRKRYRASHNLFLSPLPPLENILTMSTITPKPTTICGREVGPVGFGMLSLGMLGKTFLMHAPSIPREWEQWSHRSILVTSKLTSHLALRSDQPTGGL